MLRRWSAAAWAPGADRAPVSPRSASAPAARAPATRTIPVPRAAARPAAQPERTGSRQPRFRRRRARVTWESRRKRLDQKRRPTAPSGPRRCGVRPGTRPGRLQRYNRRRSRRRRTTGSTWRAPALAPRPRAQQGLCPSPLQCTSHSRSPGAPRRHRAGRARPPEGTLRVLTGGLCPAGALAPALGDPSLSTWRAPVRAAGSAGPAGPRVANAVGGKPCGSHGSSSP